MSTWHNHFIGLKHVYNGSGGTLTLFLNVWFSNSDQALLSEQQGCLGKILIYIYNFESPCTRPIRVDRCKMYAYSSRKRYEWTALGSGIRWYLFTIVLKVKWFRLRINFKTPFLSLYWLIRILTTIFSIELIGLCHREECLYSFQN